MRWATARCPKAWKTRPGLPRPIARKLRSRSPRSEFPGGQPRTSRTKPEDFALMSDSARVMPEHPPVTDWVHDFDHTDPRWTENPYPIWNELRAAAPVVHTEPFLARCDEEAGTSGARDLQRVDRHVHRRRQMRRRRALHQAHSGSRHRPHARHPRKGRRPLHQMDSRDPRARYQGR